MKKTLTRDQILAAQDLPRELVHVPEWGGDVLLIGLSAAEADRLASEAAGDERLFSLRLLAASIVDESGQRLFDTEDLEGLRGKNNQVIIALLKSVNRLNGFGESAEKN